MRIGHLYLHRETHGQPYAICETCHLAMNKCQCPPSVWPLAAIFIAAVLFIAMAMLTSCGNQPPTPPLPSVSASPSATATPGFDLAACLDKAQADCTKACATDQGCFNACDTVRANTCHSLGGN